MQIAIGDLIVKDERIHCYMAGCNFNCPFCFRGDLIESKQEHNRDFKEFIQELREHAKSSKEIIITGGEPLLQRQALLLLLKEAKNLNLKTILETNASKPSVLKEILESKTLDTLRFSLKAPMDGTFEKVTKSQTFFMPTQAILNDLHKSFTTAKEYEEKVNIEFTTTIVPGLVFRKEDFEAMAAEVAKTKATWIFKPFSTTGNIRSKIYENVSSPSEDFINKIKDHVKSKFPNLHIEVELTNASQEMLQQLI